MSINGLNDLITLMEAASLQMSSTLPILISQIDAQPFLLNVVYIEELRFTSIIEMRLEKKSIKIISRTILY